MKKTYWILFLILLIFKPLLSNNLKNDLKKIYRNAEYSYLFELFDEAVIDYSKVLESQPENANIHYKMGLCYLQINSDNNINEALSHLEQAIKQTSKTYKNNFKETNAPYIAWVYYGDALRLNYQFEEAIKAYNKYLELKPYDKQNKSYLERELRNCKNAPEIYANPIRLDEYSNDYHIKRRGEYESCPVISEDETIVVFSFGKDNILPADILSLSTTCDYRTDDIYYTKKENGIWIDPVNIMQDLDVSNKSLPTSISAEGNVLYLVEDNNDNGNIYKSEYKDEKWSKIEKLDKTVSSSAWETYASISSDNKTLYFSSDRKGGYGGFDIYKSVLTDEGKWEKPVNLGSNINTEYDEDTPNITRDGKVLYFSSQGHKNMGGFDIFKSDLIDKEFSKAENVGYPLNTPGNDLFVLTQHSGQIAFSPFNNDNLRGLKDDSDGEVFIVIPKKKIIKVRAEVVFANHLDSFPQNIILDTTNIQYKKLLIVDNIISFETETDSLELKISGNNTDTAIVYVSFKDTVSSQLDLLAKLNIHITNNSNNIDNNIEGVVPVIPIVRESKEVYFQFDKYKISSKFDNELLEIIEMCNSNLSQKILIEGYADPVGPEAYNLVLSQKRADVLKKELIKRGIEAKRITSKGMGETNENSNNYYNRKTVVNLYK